MSAKDKLFKLAGLARKPAFRTALARHRVAAAIEHLDAIAWCGARTLVDVGANKGQFSLAWRGLTPAGRIHAFEPLPSAAARFEAVFAGDDTVTLHRCAIGAERTQATFFVTDREDSSSLLEPGAGQKEAFAVSAKSRIEVPVRPLEDEVDLAALAHPVLLKIDVQGGELAVLGGIGALDAIDFIYVELSFVELYLGQPLFEDVRAFLAARGFVLRGVFNQAFTEAFGPTQADCLFVRA
ncbi:FkbM family methyltransferase [Parablastomonas sp. CN1-191]|uniref:FkbM family methyltransferase n=1 Tax=Parablastomonas sp. CN1-191 TaxID=3400908 RepID=UPI003BF773CC